MSIYEEWTRRIVQADVPAVLKGTFLYNQACIYALHDRLEDASVHLQRALVLHPSLKQFSLSDPDLAAVRERSESGLANH